MWWLDVVCDAFPTLRCLFADGASTGSLVGWATEQFNLLVEVVKRSAAQHGVVRLPRRWAVARTLAWLGRHRRLAKDDEVRPACRQTRGYLAAIRLLVNRLVPT